MDLASILWRHVLIHLVVLHMKLFVETRIDPILRSCCKSSYYLAYEIISTLTWIQSFCHVSITIRTESQSQQRILIQYVFQVLVDSQTASAAEVFAAALQVFSPWGKGRQEKYWQQHCVCATRAVYMKYLQQHYTSSEILWLRLQTNSLRGDIFRSIMVISLMN